LAGIDIGIWWDEEWIGSVSLLLQKGVVDLDRLAIGISNKANFDNGFLEH